MCRSFEYLLPYFQSDIYLHMKLDKYSNKQTLCLNIITENDELKVPSKETFNQKPTYYIYIYYKENQVEA